MVYNSRLDFIYLEKTNLRNQLNWWERNTRLWRYIEHDFKIGLVAKVEISKLTHHRLNEGWMMMPVVTILCLWKIKGRDGISENGDAAKGYWWFNWKEAFSFRKLIWSIIVKMTNCAPLPLIPTNVRWEKFHLVGDLL